MKIVAFFLKKVIKIFGGSENMLYICTRKSKGYGSVAQLNRVLDYGSSGSRFESWRSHKAVIERLPLLFFILPFLHPDEHSLHSRWHSARAGWHGVVVCCRVAWRWLWGGVYNKKTEDLSSVVSVPRTRLELARANAHYPLKVACLPISPPGL